MKTQPNILQESDWKLKEIFQASRGTFLSPFFKSDSLCNGKHIYNVVCFSLRSYLREYLLISYETIHQIMFSSFMLCSQPAEAKVNGIGYWRRHNLAQPKHKHTHYWLNEDSFTFTPLQQTDRGDAKEERQIKNWKCQDWLDFHMSAVTHLDWDSLCWN